MDMMENKTQTTRKSKVRICPFCGHHGHKLLHDTVKIRYEDGETEIRDIYQMECKCCGAKGPTEYSARFAVESWNFLHKKPAHSDDPMEEDFEYEDCLDLTEESENEENG